MDSLGLRLLRHSGSGRWFEAAGLDLEAGGLLGNQIGTKPELLLLLLRLTLIAGTDHLCTHDLTMGRRALVRLVPSAR